jgi:AcrR family transcriptional regulator
MAAVQERSRATEERILETAKHLVEQLPFEAVSIAMIAQAAGVSVGGVYARFESKEALLRALHDRYEQYRSDFLSETLDPSKWRSANLQECIRGVCTALVDLMLEHRGVLRSFLLHHWTRPGELPRPFSQRLDDVYRSALEVLLIDRRAISARDPERAGRTALAIVAGACRDIIVMKPAGAPGAANVPRAELIDSLTHAMLGILRAGEVK